MIEWQLSDSCQLTSNHFWYLPLQIVSTEDVVFIHPSEWTTVVNFCPLAKLENEVSILTSRRIRDDWHSWRRESAQYKYFCCRYCRRTSSCHLRSGSRIQRTLIYITRAPIRASQLTRALLQVCGELAVAIAITCKVAYFAWVNAKIVKSYIVFLQTKTVSEEDKMNQKLTSHSRYCSLVSGSWHWQKLPAHPSHPFGHWTRHGQWSKQVIIISLQL